jgi:hypothetical protein
MARDEGGVMILYAKGLLGFPPPWGFNYSRGMDVLADKIRATGQKVDPGYGWTETAKMIARINSAPLSEKIIYYGHSMGANDAPIISRSVSRSIELMIGFDPTVWYALPPIPRNVKRAICIRSNNYMNMVGHGYFTVEDSKATRLQTYDTMDEHTVLDDDAKLHAIALAAIRETLA